MKRRVLKAISMVTVSMILGLGGINSFASDSVIGIVRDGNEKILESVKTSGAEDKNVMKLAKIASSNLLNNIKANIICDGNVNMEKKSIKGTLKR